MQWFRRLLPWLGARKSTDPPVITPPAPPSPPPPAPTPSGTVEEETVDMSTTTKEDAMPAGRPTLKKGDKGTMVEELQRLLNQNGAGIKVDGDYGDRTARAVADFDQSYGLKEDGTADPTTWAILDRPPFSQMPELAGVPLAPEKPVAGAADVGTAWNAYGGLLGKLAALLGFSPSAAVAVLATESSGKGFAPDGRMVIRFEVHIFYSRWGRANTAKFDQHFKFDPNQTWTGHYWRSSTDLPWEHLHTGATGQAGEWGVLEFARKLDEEAALDSISMGAPQVMGFNSLRVGQPTARAMFDAWGKSERAQVLGLFDFIRADHRMVRALRTADWTAFATRYNGSGQAAHYGSIIAGHVAEAKAAGVP